MVRTKRPNWRLIAMIAPMLLASQAGASVQLVTDPAAWNAATEGMFFVTADFNGLAPAVDPYFTDFNTVEGVTVADVHFVGYTAEAGVYSLKVVNPSSTLGNRGSGDYLAGGWAQSYILATLPGAGATALSIGVNTTTAADIPVTVTVYSEGATLTDAFSSLGSGGLQTRRYISDTPITSVRISASGNFAVVDDFSYGETPMAPTPEPQGLVLGATGLAGIWLARRLRRWC